MELRLHAKQSLAYNSVATEILFGGAAGGGKSHLMRVASIMWASLVPGLQVYLFRRQSGDLYKNHMEGRGGYLALLEGWLLDGFVRINHSTGVITFWNGSKIYLCHCQHEKDRFKYLGAEIDVLLVDELTTFTKTIYKFLRSRCRSTALKISESLKGIKFPRIICSSNPGNIGHNWVKQDFVDKCGEDLVRMPKSEGGMLRQFIQSKLDDNPSLDAEEYEGQLEGLGDPELVRAMLHGDWDIVAGGMFDDVWDREIHILQPFKIPSSWYIDRSFDWGSSKPWSVGWWAESDGSRVTLADGTKMTFPPKTLFRIGELYGWTGEANKGQKKSAKKIAAEIKAHEKKLGIASRVKPGPADSSIYDKQNDNCIAEDMAKAGVKWKEANKAPGTRVNGWQLVRERLEASKEFPMEEPGLFVFSNCKDGFIRTVPVLPRDEDKPDDVDTDAEDHTGDEVRYRCLHKKPVVKLGKLRA